MNPRQLAAILGGLLLLAGLIALAIPVSARYDAGLFGRQGVNCGSTFSPKDEYSGAPEVACEDAISTRRAWSWPLGAAGAVVFAGAFLVEGSRRRPVSDR